MAMSERESTDTALIDRVREGDETAFRVLVERYEPQVAATVVGMLGPGDEADDVGQETFVRFYRALAKFRGDAALGTYMTRIAMNLSLNAMKRRQKQRWRFWSRDDEEKAPPESSVDGRDEQAAEGRSEAVHAALARLKPDFRAVVVLRMLDGYSTKETAALLKIAEGTVLSRLRKRVIQPRQSKYQHRRHREVAAVTEECMEYIARPRVAQRVPIARVVPIGSLVTVEVGSEIDGNNRATDRVGQSEVNRHRQRQRHAEPKPLSSVESLPQVDRNEDHQTERRQIDRCRQAEQEADREQFAPLS